MLKPVHLYMHTHISKLWIHINIPSFQTIPTGFFLVFPHFMFLPTVFPIEKTGYQIYSVAQSYNTSKIVSQLLCTFHYKKQAILKTVQELFAILALTPFCCRLRVYSWLLGLVPSFLPPFLPPTFFSSLPISSSVPLTGSYGICLKYQYNWIYVVQLASSFHPLFLLYVCLCIYTYMYVYIYMCVCIYICVCMY